MARGRFITLEGGEGAGKSTQARRLADHLQRMGIAVVVTREPGGSPLAERIRDMVLDPSMPDHSQLAEALLFNAARADHLERLIRPALARGEWVVCDRFYDSTRVYQGIVGGLAAQKLDALDAVVVEPTPPDLTILIDLDPAVGLARAAVRRGSTAPASSPGDPPADRYEAREHDYHARLREGFLALAHADPSRCLVVDGALPVDALAAEIVARVNERFSLRRSG